ncbi:hypothetical protein SADUNF_Sadunf08G0147400 [Salix dunnii]|uniref:Maturase K n=1 Tax=Salix dunnii TaxID=1413687 RepID=A0A835K386_9ROSI|nr:hypothetical protein SADUNF_Sadunf08G0147400 [Salix dunnii]
MIFLFLNPLSCLGSSLSLEMSRQTYWHLFQMGPLLDSEHSEIKKGTVGRSFDELFCLEILRRVTSQKVVNCLQKLITLPQFQIFSSWLLT